jgi:hypothetical protein
MDTQHLKRRDEYIWRDLDGEVVILNDEGTQVCLLNKTAARIWTLADGTRTLEEIAAEVCEQFDVSAEEALSDVHEFAAQLLDAGLAEWSDEETQ